MRHIIKHCRMDTQLVFVFSKNLHTTKNFLLTQKLIILKDIFPFRCTDALTEPFQKFMSTPFQLDNFSANLFGTGTFCLIEFISEFVGSSGRIHCYLLLFCCEIIVIGICWRFTDYSGL